MICPVLLVFGRELSLKEVLDFEARFFVGASKQHAGGQPVGNLHRERVRKLTNVRKSVRPVRDWEHQLNDILGSHVGSSVRTFAVSMSFAEPCTFKTVQSDSEFVRFKWLVLVHVNHSVDYLTSNETNHVTLQLDED